MVSCVKKLSNKIINRLRRIPVFNKVYFYVRSIKKRTKILRLPYGTVMDYCIESGWEIHVVEEERQRMVYKPPYFEAGEGREYFLTSPPIYVAVLNNAMALGGTGVVITDKKILLDAVGRNTDGRIQFVSGPLIDCGERKFMLEVQPDVWQQEEAINLCGFAATNYFHLTVEILSRLRYLDMIGGISNEVPILIDAGTKQYRQMEQLINSLCQGRKVIYIPEGVRVEVGILIQPSMNAWMPMNIKAGGFLQVQDNLIAESAIRNIRQHAEQYIKRQSNRKIFISRKSTTFKRVLNEEEILPLFRQAKYEIVYAEELSWIEQIEVFSSAKCIVGASGAALTNLLYCNPGTVLGCILPEKYNFYIYSTIHHMIGGKALFLDVDVVAKYLNISGDSYLVDTERCKRFIAALEQLCGEELC